MKKIMDERIIFENLKHIKTAFLVQTLGIITILVIDGFQNGYEHARNNPLWLLVLITAIVLSYSRLRVSVELENPDRKPRKLSYHQAIIRSLAVGLIGFAAVMFSPGSSFMNAVILGIVLFTALLFPSALITYYRKRNRDEDEL